MKMEESQMPERGEIPLESWKEIGAYLLRDARTARRWEKEEGLPVHRHVHKGRPSVYAFPSELDAWKEGRKPDTEPEPEPERIALWGSPLSSFATATLLLASLLWVGYTASEAQAQGVPGITNRMVLQDEESMSWKPPGGRFSSFTNWKKATNPETNQVAWGTLAVRDMELGTTRQLTWNQDGWDRYVDFSAVSPDDRLVAFAEFNNVPPGALELNLIPLDGSAPSQTIYQTQEYFQILDWTPDAKSIVVSFNSDTRWGLAVISAEDGFYRTLKSFEGRRTRQASVSPDGQYLAYDLSSENRLDFDIFVMALDGTQDTPILESGSVIDKLPVWSPDGSQLFFVSGRTATPSLWSIPMHNGEAAGSPKLVRSGIGPVFEIRMTPEGSLYYTIRGRDRLDIYSVELGSDGRGRGEPEVATDSFLNTNWGAELSPDGARLAFYSERPEQVVVIRDLESGQENVFPVNSGRFQSIYREGPHWFPDGSSVLVSVQGPDSPGHFRMNTQTGLMEDLQLSIGNIISIGGGGDSLFYRGGGALSRMELSTGQETALLEMSATQHISDLALSPDKQQLAVAVEDPEQGSLLIRVPVDGGEPEEIHRETQRGGGSRYNTLTWTPDGRYLLRVDEDGSSVSRYPVSGGDPEPIEVSIDGAIKGLRVHPDGSRLFFSATSNKTELWVLENFLPTE